ncbi:TlpA family protein disulfide reductase [candidate division WOR-3 bacterium]|nr:TlpA family protein disulfide reductase [candidate division WOR-3 bacterium]
MRSALLLSFFVFLITGVLNCSSSQGSNTNNTETTSSEVENPQFFTISSFTNSDMKTGSNFPQMTWLSEGEEVSLTSLGANAYIIDFWATWCGPCRVEIPHLISLQDDYGDEGLVVIGISVDENANVLPAFITSNKIDYITLHTTNNDFISMVLSPGGGAIPQTYVLDSTGKIVKSFVGFSPSMKGEIEAAVESALQ